ncbi:hypothetical protein [Litoreibacter roseus]|uniref:Cytochrome C oxidase assembly protein n=1 Tax=Litoreibacter roseus TaxID=2601869 RepID=A0A6N6JH63_9RHOB|nr:hypothetical protein [Litoreibacter roseus]GFE65297.1 hypothetical protein KIN_23710 [Litoreibacter roseus]
MAIRVEHEIHNRRLGRNVGVGIVLIGFVAIIFGLTIVKVSGGAPIEAYDHTVRHSITVEDGN